MHKHLYGKCLYYKHKRLIKQLIQTEPTYFIEHIFYIDINITNKYHFGKKL